MYRITGQTMEYQIVNGIFPEYVFLGHGSAMLIVLNGDVCSPVLKKAYI